MRKCWNFYVTSVVVISFLHLTLVDTSGFLLLYRPNDVSNDCVISHHLRYDISFGHGMSDTITLVFRTLSEIDYECLIEIVTDSPNTFLLVVIRLPNSISRNCRMNADAFTVLKKNKCLRICDLIGDRDANSPYYIITVKQRLRFRFLGNSSINSDMKANFYQVTATSARKKPKKGCDPRLRFRFLGNSSINSDMKANFYQVTATSARKKPKKGCDPKNETICVTSGHEYCFTGGVVCDGIKNCGVADWYDERKSDCDETVKRIGYAPVIAVVAFLLCVILAGGHLMMRWLPPLANSFFIFNANEDNRLCIDPVFTTPDYAPCDIEITKRTSVIPVPSSSSEDQSENTTCFENVQEVETLRKDEVVELEDSFKEDRLRSLLDVKTTQRRKNTLKAMTEMFQQRLWSVAGRSKRKSKAVPEMF